MNRVQLLKWLSGRGFKADDKTTLDDVKAWLAEQALVITADDGSDLDLDAAWANEGDDGADAEKKSRVAIKHNDDAIVVSKAELAELRATIRSVCASIKGAAAPKVNKVDGAHRRFGSYDSVRDSGRKAYEARIKAGRAAYADVDVAEMTTALIRLSICGLYNYPRKSDDIEIVQKAQVEYDNALGGALVPVEFVSQLIYLTEPYGTARRIANVVRMTREVQNSRRKTAIPTMPWVGEGQSASVSNINYDNTELVAKKLLLLMQASNELLEDAAINLADDIASTVREAYDKAIDNAYFLGDGTSTYGGFVGLANALPSAAYFNASGAWSAFTTGDFNKALGTLENVDMSRVAIVCSRQFYHQVCVRLDKAASQFKELIVGGRAADGSFLGFPVYFAQVLPAATGSGVKSVYIGDFVGASMVGERRDLAISASEHSAFTSDSFQWRATARAAVNIHGDGRGSTYGPIVCLKATG